ncbi:MAG: hypothetical protein JNM10_13140, partial [Planctomycetia bacterium]|nr:hypothetical protein [Planctomycetia bacterium]
MRRLAPRTWNLVLLVGVAFAFTGCRCAPRCGCVPSASCPPAAAVAASPESVAPTSPPLPPGCSIVTHGSRPRLSPSGATMAFVRWVDLPAGTTHFVGPHRPGQSLDAVPEVWLRDLARGTERRLPGWKPESADGAIHTDRMRLPVTWTDEHTLLLDDGSLVDATTGAIRTASLELPKGAIPTSLAWSPDGTRAVCIADGPVRDDAYRSVEAVVYLLEAGHAPRPLVLRNPPDGQRLAWEAGGMNLQKGVFEWTPDGRRLRFALRLHQYGRPYFWQRTGLLDLDGTARVLATSVDVTGWRRSTWSADGTRGAFALERGGARSELFVTNADGSDVARVTDDATLKDTPHIDPAGRRLAFLTGETDERGRVPKPVVRVLDLGTGRTHDLVLPSPDDPPSHLVWMPGGDRLLYDGPGAIYEHVVEPAPTPTADDTVRRVPYEPIDLVREALAAGSDLEVAWATHVASQAWDPALVPALRAALRARLETDAFDWSLGVDLMQLLFDHEVREALPEIRLAAGPTSRIAGPAAWILATWMGKDALPDLDALRTKPEGNERFAAAAAMVALARPMHEGTRLGPRLRPGRIAGPPAGTNACATSRRLLGVVQEHAVV